MSRKGLALTLATLMIWAVSVPAFAVVEPFPDVPQDHWAYEAIESLRLAGLIEGYPDGTFGGARTFTRYEMAMVFSRILERLQAWLAGREDFLISSATGELLAALGDEFAPELEQMGISSTEYGRLLQAVAAVQADAEAAADRAYRARLAAQQARAMALEAREIAERGLAIAELAYESEEAKLASEKADQAAERAYRARLAAEDARSQAREARAVADRALAIGEMALETLEEARQAAANAEAVAAQADAKVDAAARDMAEAVQVAREADRLAFLALFTAEQALIRLDEVDKQLRTRPVISGEIRSTFEQANASQASVPRDPRDGGAGDVHDGVTAVTSSVTVRAALEPVDGVKVVGDVKLSGGRQGYTLSADVPFSFGTAVLEKGFSRSAADPANFTDSASFGVKDVDLVGFALGAKVSATNNQNGRTRTDRFELSRAFELGVPMTVTLTQTALERQGWTASFDDDDGNPFVEAARNSFSGSLSVQVVDGLTVKAGYGMVTHHTDQGKVEGTTMDVGADYNVSVLGADVSLGFGLQTPSYNTDGYVYKENARRTISIGIKSALFGGTVDAQYKQIVGRGSDGAEKVDAEDTITAVDYTYPLADNLDLTLGFKQVSSKKNADGSDYDYSSLQAGLGLTF